MTTIIAVAARLSIGTVYLSIVIADHAGKFNTNAITEKRDASYTSDCNDVFSCDSRSYTFREILGVVSRLAKVFSDTSAYQIKKC